MHIAYMHFQFFFWQITFSVHAAKFPGTNRHLRLQAAGTQRFSAYAAERCASSANAECTAESHFKKKSQNILDNYNNL